MITRRDSDFSIDLTMPVQSLAKPCCPLAWPRSSYVAGTQYLSSAASSYPCADKFPDSACSAGCVPIQYAAPLLHWGSVSAGVMV